MQNLKLLNTVLGSQKKSEKVVILKSKYDGKFSKKGKKALISLFVGGQCAREYPKLV